MDLYKDSLHNTAEYKRRECPRRGQRCMFACRMSTNRNLLHHASYTILCIVRTSWPAGRKGRLRRRPSKYKPYRFYLSETNRPSLPKKRPKL